MKAPLKFKPPVIDTESTLLPDPPEPIDQYEDVVHGQRVLVKRFAVGARLHVCSDRLDMRELHSLSVGGAILNSQLRERGLFGFLSNTY